MFAWLETHGIENPYESVDEIDCLCIFVLTKCMFTASRLHSPINVFFIYQAHTCHLKNVRTLWKFMVVCYKTLQDCYSSVIVIPYLELGKSLLVAHWHNFKQLIVLTKEILTPAECKESWTIWLLPCWWWGSCGSPRWVRSHRPGVGWSQFCWRDNPGWKKSSVFIICNGMTWSVEPVKGYPTFYAQSAAIKLASTQAAELSLFFI